MVKISVWRSHFVRVTLKVFGFSQSHHYHPSCVFIGIQCLSRIIQQLPFNLNFTRQLRHTHKHTHTKCDGCHRKERCQVLDVYRIQVSTKSLTLSSLKPGYEMEEWCQMFVVQTQMRRHRDMRHEKPAIKSINCRKRCVHFSSVCVCVCRKSNSSRNTWLHHCSRSLSISVIT